MVDAKLEPEQKHQFEEGDGEVRAAPRKNEVKHQQDWRLVFVDRPETCQSIDCLDELMGDDCWDRDLLSMSISASVCLPSINHEVRLRKAQIGPEFGMALEEDVSSDSQCSLCPGDDQKCRCFHEGREEINRVRELRRAHLCSL